MTPTHRKTWLWLLFGGYCALMLWLLYLQRLGTGPGPWQFNLQPLDTVGRFLWVLRHSADAGQRNNAAANLFGNVVLFVPLGVFLPMLRATWQPFWRFLLRIFLVILVLELTQAATGLGTCDVDDLILNLAGTLLGWLSWRFLRRS